MPGLARNMRGNIDANRTAYHSTLWRCLAAGLAGRRAGGPNGRHGRHARPDAGDVHRSRRAGRRQFVRRRVRQSVVMPAQYCGDACAATRECYGGDCYGGDCGYAARWRLLRRVTPTAACGGLRCATAFGRLWLRLSATAATATAAPGKTAAHGTNPPFPDDVENYSLLPPGRTEQCGPHYFDVRMEAVMMTRDEAFRTPVDFTSHNVAARSCFRATNWTSTARPASASWDATIAARSR